MAIGISPRDPCEPPLAGVHHPPPVSVHHHGSPHVLGRVHRHGTARLARRMQAARHGCLPGSKTLLGATLLKLAAPVAGFVALGAIAATVAATDPNGAWNTPGSAIISNGPGGGVIIVRSKHHKPVVVSEPPAGALLLAAALAWAGLRRWAGPA